ncbi:hypothetical protein GWK74_01445 [Candidatus Saccharibacteria bacterium oral taxon 488]|jgi:hypothetical protein|nr:hypothetical protein GWK74_01445 [Candidatus Saccharibacteria bacterium oral taxon 488]
MSLNLFLDLDRTLFRTSELDAAEWGLLGQQFGIDSEAELKRRTDFYVRTEKAYYYDFAAHVQAAELGEEAVFSFLLQSTLADGRMEYDGVAELVAWARQRGTVHVLTYGPANYQRFKAALCPSLEGVEIITTLQSKSDYFREQRPTGEVWMVDDKPIGGDLPDGVRFIQTVEYNNITAPEHPAWPVATALSQIPGIIDNDEISDRSVA